MQSTTKRTLPLPFFGARVKPLSSPSHCPRRRCCLSSLFHHPYTSSSSKAEDFRGINTPLGPTTLPAWLFSIRNCRHSAVTVRSKWLFISVHTWRQVQPLLSVPAFLYLSFFPLSLSVTSGRLLKKRLEKTDGSLLSGCPLQTSPTTTFRLDEKNKLGVRISSSSLL